MKEHPPGPVLIFPDPQEDPVGRKILIRHPNIRMPFAFRIFCKMGPFRAPEHDHFEHRFLCYPPLLEGKYNRGAAVHFGRRLEHEILLLRPDPCNSPVVLHADQEPPPVGVSERHEGPGDLTGVGDLEFKVELLVLAFADQCLDVILQDLKVMESFAVIFAQ